MGVPGRAACITAKIGCIGPEGGMCSTLNWPGNSGLRLRQMTVSIPGVLAGQSFLTEHHATLVPDGSKWLLTYPIAAYEYGSRLEESVDVALPIAARSYDEALKIVEMILRDHVAPVLHGAPTAA